MDNERVGTNNSLNDWLDLGSTMSTAPAEIALQRQWDEEIERDHERQLAQEVLGEA